MYIKFYGGVMDGAKVKFEHKNQIPNSLTIHSCITKDDSDYTDDLNAETDPNDDVYDNGRHFVNRKIKIFDSKEIDHVYNLDYEECEDGTIDSCYCWNEKGEVTER